MVVLSMSAKFTVRVLLGRTDLKIMFFGLLFLIIKANTAPEAPNLDNKTLLFLSSCPSIIPLMYLPLSELPAFQFWSNF